MDHCVQAVGINTAQSYWNVRNSWGTSWGESGFIRLSYGGNTCGIASDANFATVASAASSEELEVDARGGERERGAGGLPGGGGAGQDGHGGGASG